MLSSEKCHAHIAVLECLHVSQAPHQLRSSPSAVLCTLVHLQPELSRTLSDTGLIKAAHTQLKAIWANWEDWEYPTSPQTT